MNYEMEKLMKAKILFLIGKNATYSPFFLSFLFPPPPPPFDSDNIKI